MSPGSVTLEVQGVPTIARAAHRQGATVALANIYAAGTHVDAFTHDADVTMQALTKYVGGRSDLLPASITVRDEAHHERWGQAHAQVGMAVSPADCGLASPGVQTLAVRLEAIGRSALAVARRLAERPEIELVLHPAVPPCRGRAIRTRDFTGSTGIFSIVFETGYTRGQILAFVDALRLLKLGYSWGGVTGRVAPYLELQRSDQTSEDRLARL